MSLVAGRIEWVVRVKSKDGYPRVTSTGVKRKNSIMEMGLIVELRRKPGYRVAVSEWKEVREERM